jgi:hypothetical protein
MVCDAHRASQLQLNSKQLKRRDVFIRSQPHKRTRLLPYLECRSRTDRILRRQPSPAIGCPWIQPAD